jgi:biopolymer transport protein ExbD
MKIQTSKKPISATMLISMTDVVFLLLLFLLVSSSFVTQSGIPIRLPASSNQAQQNPKTVSITLTADNQVFVENEAVTWESLPQRLSSLSAMDRERVVYLRADEVTALKKVVSLMDIVRQSGFERIYIATKQIGETKP